MLADEPFFDELKQVVENHRQQTDEDDMPQAGETYRQMTVHEFAAE